MSPTNMIGQIGRFRTLVREKVTPRVTSGCAYLGFADRSQLVAGLRASAANRHDLLLDSLIASGTIKQRFTKDLTSLDQLRPFMLKANITAETVGAWGVEGLDSAALIAENRTVVAKLGRGIVSGYYSICHYAGTAEGLSAAFSSGTKAAKAAAVVLGVGGAAWFFGLPTLSAGLGLGAATALCVLAAKYGDSFPTHGLAGKVGSVARFVSRKIAPFVYAIDGLYLGSLVYDNNLRIAGIFDSLGLEGSVAVLGGLGLGIKTWVGKKLGELRRSHGGQLDPGNRHFMEKSMRSAALSSAAELHYIGTRLMLLGGAAFYIGGNVIASLGTLGIVPLAIPLAVIGATALLRARHDIAAPGKEVHKTFWQKLAFWQDGYYTEKKQAEKLDNTKINLPLWGGIIGFGASAVISLAVGAPAGSWQTALLGPIGFATFYGSLATFFLNELHGAGHSLNTNLGYIASLKASSRDLVGETEKKKLTDSARILAVNPHTGMKEHTYGLLFSVLLNRKPGLSFICMYDYILSQKDGQDLPNRNNHRQEKQFLAEVTRIQAGIFDLARGGIAGPMKLADKYRQLIANLHALSRHYRGPLVDTLNALTAKNKGWFEPFQDVAEYRRAAFEQLEIRGDEFRQLADKLQRKLDKGYISAEDFNAEWTRLLHCYDPDLVKKIPVARKAVAGDERKVRKVENVAAGLIMRGLTIYKGWYTETEEDKTRHPQEDWISGDWTQVPNPNFSYTAEPGTLAGAKYLWVRAEEVMVDLQKKNRKYLSTSRFVSSVDNRPSRDEGFVELTLPADQAIVVPVNGRQVPITSFYYVAEGDQNAYPAVKALRHRPGAAPLPAGYEFPYQGHLANDDLKPYVFTPPAFDFSVMMDKNDIQVNSYTLLPTILKRAKRDKFIHLVLRYPVGDRAIEADNPFPLKELDLSKGVGVIDANIELRYRGSDGIERVAPFQIDRAAAHVGINESMGWKDMTGAVVEMRAGKPVAFSLVYNKTGKKEDDVLMPMPPRDWPQYLGSLGLPADGPAELKINNFTAVPLRDGDPAWLKFYYTDGSVGFARTADGRRPMLMNKDLYAETGRP